MELLLVYICIKGKTNSTELNFSSSQLIEHQSQSVKKSYKYKLVLVSIVVTNQWEVTYLFCDLVYFDEPLSAKFVGSVGERKRYS